MTKDELRKLFFEKLFNAKTEEDMEEVSDLADALVICGEITEEQAKELMDDLDSSLV